MEENEQNNKKTAYQNQLLPMIYGGCYFYNSNTLFVPYGISSIL